MKETAYRWFVPSLVILFCAAGFALFLAHRGSEPTNDAVPDLVEGHFNIYILGGSTARGEPYEKLGGFGGIMAPLFGKSFKERPLTVRNLGRGGANTGAVLKIAEKIPPGADLVILYAGNNEFLRFDSDYSPTGRDRKRFDNPTVSEDARKAILREYRENMVAIAESIRAKKAPLIISTVAVNLADWRPNRSVLENPLNAGDVGNLLDAAQVRISSGQNQAAREILTEALELEPGFAESHMVLGDVDRELGLFDEAMAHYQKAADLDGNRYRVVSEQNDFIRKLALTTDGVHLLDAAEFVAGKSPHRLPGFNLFWDNCHPTLEGYYLIALGIARKMNEIFETDQKLSLLERDRMESDLDLSRQDQHHVYHSRGQFLYLSATRTWSPQRRLDRASHYLSQAATIEETAALIFSMGVVHAIAGDGDAAFEKWKAAAEKDPALIEKRLNHIAIRQLIEQNGWENQIEF